MDATATTFPKCIAYFNFVVYNKLMNDRKNKNFKRLAKLRGDRIVKDLRLLGNLANKNNYSYTDSEVNAIFSVIEQELKISKANFLRHRKREIKL
jgi:hypothetical protein